MYGVPESVAIDLLSVSVYAPHRTSKGTGGQAALCHPAGDSLRGKPVEIRNKGSQAGQFLFLVTWIPCCTNGNWGRSRELQAENVQTKERRS